MTLIDNVDDYLYLKESENGNLKFEVDAHQLDLRLHHFSQFPLNVKKKKLAGLWLAGKVVNHVGIYGSKAAEGLSAFQRRSCLQEYTTDQIPLWHGNDFHIINTLRRRQDDCHFTDDTFKRFSWMKILESRLKFHWSLFLRVQWTIIHHWFR